MLAFQKEGSAKERRKRAMAALDVNDDEDLSSVRFMSGTATGVCIMLVAVISGTAYLPNVVDIPARSHMIPMWRLTACCVLLGWAWAANIYVYSKVRINYRLIFDFDPRHYLLPAHILQASALFSALWMLFMAVWLLSIKGTPGFEFGQDNQVRFPIFLFVIAALGFIGQQYLECGWFIKVCWNIIRAPFVEVKFRDFYVADQLTTIAITLVDFELMTCLIIMGDFSDNADTQPCLDQNAVAKPLLAVIPSWWRFLQCLRRYRDACPSPESATCGAYWHSATSGAKGQLYNALKYACAFPIVFFSMYRTKGVYDDFYFVGWCISVAYGASYKYYWDILHDWGLGDPSNGYLRPRWRKENGDLQWNSANHLYPIWHYYVAAAINLVLRFLWPLTISPEYMNPDILGTTLAILEIFRRGMWNLFRLENEHLNNCGNYRATSVRHNVIVDRLQNQSELDSKFFPASSPQAPKGVSAH